MEGLPFYLPIVGLLVKLKVTVLDLRFFVNMSEMTCRSQHKQQTTDQPPSAREREVGWTCSQAMAGINGDAN